MGHGTAPKGNDNDPKDTIVPLMDTKVSPNDTEVPPKDTEVPPSQVSYHVVFHPDKLRHSLSSELVNAANTQQLDQPTRVPLHHITVYASRDLQQSLHGNHAHVVSD